MSDPRISVVLPTYNRTLFLRQAIDSVLAQTRTDWELIIVDDHSDVPEVATVISEYAQRDARIQAIYHETNRRLPAALNTGFASARGDLLTWTTDDNVYEPQALQAMAERLEADADLAMVYTEYVRIDERGHVLGPGFTRPPDQLLRQGNCIGPCFLYRRALRDAVGDYADDMFMAEDHDYWLRASQHGRMALIDQPLYRYRVHGDSLSVTARQAQAMASVRAMERFVAGDPLLTDRRWAEALCMASRYAVDGGDGPLARSHLRNALRRDVRFVFAHRGRLLARCCVGSRLNNVLRIVRRMFTRQSNV